MVYILNIETATKNCSVSVAKDGQTIALREISELGYSHAEKLHVFIAEALQAAGISANELSAVAVSRGPGSYTGLRIGVSAAKGLCFALDIPLIAVDTLQSLAAQLHVSDGVIIPLLDARRMEVYSAVFDSDFTMIRDIKAEIIDSNSFSEIRRRKYFVGDAVAKCKEILTSANTAFVDEIVFPSAQEMSAISYDHFLGNHFVDTAYFEPFYLKDFVTTTSKK